MKHLFSKKGVPQNKMSESEQIILGLIDRVSGKLKSLSALTALSYAFLFLSGGFLTTALLVTLTKPVGFWSGVAFFVKMTTILGIAFALAKWLAKDIKEAKDRKRTALKIEKTIPHLNNELVVSLELIEREEEYKAIYSLELAKAYIEKSAQLLKNLDYSPALPIRRTKKWSLSAILTLLIAFVFAYFYPVPSKQALAFLLSSAVTPSKVGGSKFTEKPLAIGDFEIRYDYPSYTGWESKIYSGGDGSLRAIKGTIVTIKAKSGVALKTAKIQMEKTSIPATITDKRAIEARITLMEPGWYKISAQGTDGENYSESSAHSIEVLTDEFPFVEIASPAKDQEFEEAGVLPIEFAGEDDFGISEVAIAYSIAGTNGRVKIIAPDDARKKISGTYIWDLSALDLQPGDEVRYYIEILDNDTISGPKKAVSKSYRLSIFSPRREHTRLVNLQWELMDRMVAVLGDVLVRDSGTDEKLNAEKLIAEGMEDITKRLDEITTGLQKDKLADMNTLELLKNLHAELKDLLEKRKRILAKAHPSETEFAPRRAEETTTLENAIIALDNELERQKVAEVMMRGKELLEAQRRVAELLAKVRAGDKDALTALNREMARMQEIMKDLMEALSRTKGNLPEDFINVDALKNLPLSSSADIFEKLRRAIEEGDMENAMKMAEEMQSMLANMMSAMESGAMAFGMGRSGEAIRKLDEYSKRLEDLKKRQEKLFEQTQNIGVETQQNLLEKQKGERQDMMKKLAQLMAQLRKKMEETQQAVEKFQPSDKGVLNDPTFRDAIFRIGASIQNLLDYRLTKAEEFLDTANLYNLYDTMQTILNEAGLLQKNAHYLDDLKGVKGKSSRKIADSADEIVSITEEIISILEKMMKPPERKLGSRELDILNEMATEQEQLRRDTEALQAEMEEFRKQFPFMNAEQERKIGEAGQAMGDAGGKLKRHDPNGALSPQALALRKLSELGEELQGLKERMMQGASMPIPIPYGGGSESGMSEEHGYQTPGVFHPGKVEIPGRESYKVPEKFREDILKAMQNRAPKLYEMLNKDYYRKLIE